MATLKDISKLTGISVTQVSRALNGHGDVNDETRSLVEEAAKKLNYHPNLSARRLVTGRSGIVALALPDLPERQLDGFHMQMISILSRYFSERRMQFILHVYDPREDVVKVHMRLANSGSVDGFLLVNPEMDDPRIKYLTEAKMPFVVHGRTEPKPPYPFFDIDNFAVGYALTKMLAEKGHKRIAFLNGPDNRAYAIERKAAYFQALKDFDCEILPALHSGAEMSDAFGLIGAVQLWGPDGPKPTAIIAGNTMVARGLASGLTALNVRIPDDVSIVCHDDDLPNVTLGNSQVPTRLAGTRAPLDDGWRGLAAILVDRISGKDIKVLQRFGQYSLIKGASLAAPAKAV